MIAVIQADFVIDTNLYTAVVVSDHKHGILRYLWQCPFSTEGFITYICLCLSLSGSILPAVL